MSFKVCRYLFLFLRKILKQIKVNSDFDKIFILKLLNLTSITCFSEIWLQNVGWHSTLVLKLMVLLKVCVLIIISFGSISPKGERSFQIIANPL
jgi:hypothetical protein